LCQVRSNKLLIFLATFKKSKSFLIEQIPGIYLVFLSTTKFKNRVLHANKKFETQINLAKEVQQQNPKNNNQIKLLLTIDVDSC
jgi:hypothetical protein